MSTATKPRFWSKTRFELYARPRGSKVYQYWRIFNHVEYAEKKTQLLREQAEGKWTYVKENKPIQVDEHDRPLNSN